MKREAAFYQDMILDIKTVKDDTRQQIEDIESFIEQGVDLLVISPNEATALTPIVKQAMVKDIPVILLDRKIDSENYTAYIGADNYQLAKELALYATDVLHGAGNIVIMRGWEGSTADRMRYKGFMEIIEKSPKISIVAEDHGQFLKNDAQEEMSKILKQDISIDLVFAMNDPMAYGVHDALVKYSGKMPFIIGIDALAGEGGGIEAIETGIIDASFIYPTGGDKVIELAHKVLNKEEYQKENILYTAAVDKSNARILKLQHTQIVDQQVKFDKTNQLLDQSMAQYANQRSLFYLSLVAILLVSAFLIFAILAYRSKSKINTKLSKQNKKIRRQTEKLEEQKDKLLALSEQLEDATNAKLMFFTNISHEFKTPLSLILGPIDTLMSMEHDAKQTELLQLIKRNSNRLLQLISEIIEFRSYENGKMNVNFSKDNLASFVEDITSYFESYRKDKNINLNLDIEDESFMLYYDDEKMEKVYFNLLSNAFKHVDKDGEITIRLRKVIDENKEYAELSVHNTGSYIPEKEQKNVFGRFYIMDNETGDTGIGLALVSVMLEIHGGHISVDSSKESGTEFKVSIPFEQDLNKNSIQTDSYKIGTYSESRIEAESKPTEQVHLPNRIGNEDLPLLLVIEDNEDMRQFIKLTLQSDYNILEAVDGEEGIEMAVKYTPDLIISDVMMPRKNGYEVGQYLRENVSTSHIPLIMLTACSLDEQKSQGFESGADAYIPKPFNESLLRIRIRKLIESRQKMKENFSMNLIEDKKKDSLAQNEQKFIDKFTEYIESNIANSKLNVEEIAKHVGLSKSQLYRKLKSLTDYSPNELIRIIRLKSAKQMLLSGSSTVSDVAYALGFSSPSYFTKCFKEFYGESPRDMIVN